MTTPSAGGPRGVHAHRVSRRSQLDRNIDRNSELLARFGGARVSVPALYLRGVLRDAPADRANLAFASDYLDEFKIGEGNGHRKL